jgi:hypothetical protein
MGISHIDIDTTLHAVGAENAPDAVAPVAVTVKLVPGVAAETRYTPPYIRFAASEVGEISYSCTRSPTLNIAVAEENTMVLDPGVTAEGATKLSTA